MDNSTSQQGTNTAQAISSTETSSTIHIIDRVPIILGGLNPIMLSSEKTDAYALLTSKSDLKRYPLMRESEINISGITFTNKAAREIQISGLPIGESSYWLIFNGGLLRLKGTPVSSENGQYIRFTFDHSDETVKMFEKLTTGNSNGGIDLSRIDDIRLVIMDNMSFPVGEEAEIHFRFESKLPEIKTNLVVTTLLQSSGKDVYTLNRGSFLLPLQFCTPAIDVYNDFLVVKNMRFIVSGVAYPVRLEQKFGYIRVHFDNIEMNRSLCISEEESTDFRKTVVPKEKYVNFSRHTLLVETPLENARSGDMGSTQPVEIAKIVQHRYIIYDSLSQTPVYAE